MKNRAWCVGLRCGCGVGVDSTGTSSSGLNAQDGEDETVDARASAGEAPLPVPALQACDVDKECGPGASCDNPEGLREPGRVPPAANNLRHRRGLPGALLL
ncbi:MAG: hypothetical protein AMXMBFR34_12720 [Myxococcaceae bacterium]